MPWTIRRTGHLQGGICRQRPGLRKVESSASLHPPIAAPSRSAGHKQPICGMSAGSRRKAAINAILPRAGQFIKNLRFRSIFECSHYDGIAALEFESANPTIIKSIKQRDLLNTWLRLYVRSRQIPSLREYQPSRLSDELPDLVYMTVDSSRRPPRLIIDSDGTRMSTPTAIQAGAAISTTISGPGSHRS